MPSSPSNNRQTKVATTQNNGDDPAHIQDPGERKKVQNRIAQRSYRKRIKERMEALENLHEASITGFPHMILPDNTSPALSHPSSIVSTSPVPSITHQRNFRQRPQSARSIVHISSPGRDEGASNQRSPQCFAEPSGALGSHPLDGALSFKSSIDENPQEFCNLSPGMDMGFDMGEISKAWNVEYRNDNSSRPSPDAIEDVNHNTSFPNHNDIPQEEPPLLNKGGNKIPLHVASENGKASTVRLLLSLTPNTDILALDRAGRTALHLAVLNRHTPVIQELLKHPSSAQQDLAGARDGDGRTALHVAADQGFVEGVASLLAAGAEMEAKDGEGRTAVHLAAAKGWDGVVKSLFEWGADINAQMVA